MKKIIAKAVRLEFEEKSDTFYIVFQVCDEGFKKTIKEDWSQDMEVKLLGKNLYNPQDKDI